LYIPSEKTDLFRDFIQEIPHADFSVSRILKTGLKALPLVESEYFALCLFPRTQGNRPLLISNNPDDFLLEYLNVFKQDFLFDSIIETGSEYVLSRDANYSIPEHGEFIETVQRARPISDIVYLPIKVQGVIGGCWAMGRADGKRPPYSESQLELARFLSSFLTEALLDSYFPSPTLDALAYLNEMGEVISAGDAIAGAFHDLFGGGKIPVTTSRRNLQEHFKKSCMRFLHEPPRLGAKRLTLANEGATYSFHLELLESASILSDSLLYPCAAVRLLEDMTSMLPGSLADLEPLMKKFSLTPRECEVVQGIYQARSNKVIASELHIDESTVKRHTHNIYEKTGLRSRVELVRFLSMD
jgi:DNA-binding CsgD family transcriptional regulator